MNTCSYTIHFKEISLCSKVFVECITYFGKLNKASSSSSSSSEPLIREATSNTKKLKRNLLISIYECKCVHHMLSTKKLGHQASSVPREIIREAQTNTPVRCDMTLVSESIPKRAFIKNSRSVDQ